MRHRLLISTVAAILAGCSAGPRFTVCPETAPAVRAYASALGGWADRLAPAIRPVPTTAVDAQESPGPVTVAAMQAWTRDAWLFGCLDGAPAALMLGSDDTLAPWARNHLAADGVKVLSAGRPREWPRSRYDAGGNVIVSPPQPGWPMGRIIVGRDMQLAIKKFLAASRSQTDAWGRLIEVDTSWLRVGHADELVAFVPSPGAPGFKLVTPDAQSALRIVRAAPPDRAVFAGAGSAELAGQVSGAGARFLEDASRDFSGAPWKYVRIVSGAGAGQVARIAAARDHRLMVECVWNLHDYSGRASAATGLAGAVTSVCDRQPVWFDWPDRTSRYLLVQDSQMFVDAANEPVPAVVSAGELARDPVLAAAAERANRRIAATRQRVVRALGLRDGDCVPLPVLVIDDGAGEQAWWLSPNPVNLLNVNGRVVVLRPFGPRAQAGDDATDLFAGEVLRQLAAASSASVVVLDGWQPLHRGNGGARCGTNVLRTCSP